jgi:hypothetical protein
MSLVPRCPAAMSVCSQAMPPFTQMGGERCAAISRREVTTSDNQPVLFNDYLRMPSGRIGTPAIYSEDTRHPNPYQPYVNDLLAGFTKSLISCEKLNFCEVEWEK